MMLKAVLVQIKKTPKEVVYLFIEKSAFRQRRQQCSSSCYMEYWKWL